MQYEITNTETLAKTIVQTIDAVAAMIEVDADEIEWALEDEGMIETDLHRVVEIAA